MKKLQDPGLSVPGTFSPGNLCRSSDHESVNCHYSGETRHLSVENRNSDFEAIF